MSQKHRATDKENVRSQGGMSLATDPAEEANLAKKDPTRVKAMFEDFQKYLVPFGQ